MTLYGFTDGASRGNPGESGIGILLKNEAGDVIFSSSAYIGIATNNMAEYTALLALLRKVQTMPCDHLVVSSDSELMVKQMNGQYRVRNKEIEKIHRTITTMLNQSSFRFEIRHVSRQKNAEADRLANEGINSGTRQSREGLPSGLKNVSHGAGRATASRSQDRDEESPNSAEQGAL